MQVLTYNLFDVSRLGDYLHGKEAGQTNTVLRTAGYYSLSPMHNMGSVYVYMTFLPVVHLTLKIVTCFTSSGL